MFHCSACNQTKPESEYYYQKNGRRSSYCKPCYSSYQGERLFQKKIDALTYKGNKCEDCLIVYDGNNHCIFDFHHLDPSKKDVQWDKLRLRSWGKITLELDKCICLCSNCHRMRHHEERKLVGVPGVEPEFTD